MTRWRKELNGRSSVLLAFIAVLWIVRILDAILPVGVSVAGHGVVPRTSYGLKGIVLAPLIHASFDHLIANTIPLLILGAIILMRGRSEFVFVTGVTALVSGAGIWLFGTPGTHHVGASGVVFGFFGFLVFRTAFDRRIGSAFVTLALAVLYGTSMAYSLIPSDGISWSGHFFGFLGGILAARWRYPATSRRAATLRW